MCNERLSHSPKRCIPRSLLSLPRVPGLIPFTLTLNIEKLFTKYKGNKNPSSHSKWSLYRYFQALNLFASTLLRRLLAARTNFVLNGPAADFARGAAAFLTHGVSPPFMNHLNLK